MAPINKKMVKKVVEEPKAESSDDDTDIEEQKPEEPKVEESSDDETEPDAEPPAVVPVKKVRAKKAAGDAPKKPRKVHKEKASEFDEGYTKTEDGIDYIVKNKRWVVVKPEKKAVQKKAPTAYGRFIGDKMKEIRAEQPGLPSSEYMKLAMVEWRALSVEEKAALKAATAAE